MLGEGAEVGPSLIACASGSTRSAAEITDDRDAGVGFWSHSRIKLSIVIKRASPPIRRSKTKCQDLDVDSQYYNTGNDGFYVLEMKIEHKSYYKAQSGYGNSSHISASYKTKKKSLWVYHYFEKTPNSPNRYC